MNIFTCFNRPPSVETDFTDAPSKVQPQFARDCDINVQLAKIAAGDTSLLKRTGAFYDATMLPESYHEMLNITVKGREAWESLSPELRRRFNCVENLLDFLSDPNNRDEAVRFGLVNPLPPADKVGETRKTEDSKSDAHA